VTITEPCIRDVAVADDGAVTVRCSDPYNGDRYELRLDAHAFGRIFGEVVFGPRARVVQDSPAVRHVLAGGGR
jgi:hypothetical protein